MPSLLTTLLARLARPVRARVTSGDDGGFTLIEAVVSLTLFAVVGTASTMAIVNATRTNTLTKSRVVATDLAQRDLQQARAIAQDSPLKIAASTAHAVGANGLTYNGSGTKFMLARVLTTPCAAVADGKSMLVTATVTWPNSGAGVSMATEVAC